MSTETRAAPRRATLRSRSEQDEFGGEIGAGAARTIRAPWGASSVSRVRQALYDDLVARDVASGVIEEAQIVTSELMANAIRHARPLGDHTVRIHWRVKSGVVEVDVTDGGSSTTPRPAPRALWRPSGRGLRIVRSLAHEWGVSENRGAVTVWASLGGPSRRRASSS